MSKVKWQIWASALAGLAPVQGLSQSLSIDCSAVNGQVPEECIQGNAGTAVGIVAGENTEMEEHQGSLGEDGFSISIEAENVSTPPVVLEGSRFWENKTRKVDRLLADANVQVRVDGLNATPRLTVSTDGMKNAYPAGGNVEFQLTSNYPKYIERAEIRIADARNPARVIATVPISANGSANWVMPETGVDQMVYSARVYDPRGRYDETVIVPIARRSVQLQDPGQEAAQLSADAGEDMTRRRTIPVHGGSVTIFSDGLAPGGRVSVMGEPVQADENGAFIVQRILPPGTQSVHVGVGARDITRRVEIPKSDWFYFATIDVTAGVENGDAYQFGRIAGFAKGRTATGWTLTGAVDTGERDLELLFRELDAREPLNLIRSVRDEDVFLTFGDDSTVIDEAPTSGKLFLKAEKNGSHIMFGDFKLADEEQGLVRSDRTLFGLHGHYQTTNNLTNEGRPRFQLSGYAGTPDRLMQRDVFDATGGAGYFLKRQGILTGSSTVYVQYRDPATGRIVQRKPLIEGQDYRINHFQGVLILNKPLAPFVGDNLLNDNTMGRYEVELVAQYEYVPTFGVVDGSSYGARAEGWLNDHIRVGLSAQQEDTGVAENTLYGADVLLRKSDLTFLHMSAAQSEGPGFGFDTSTNGGFDFSDTATAGQVGLKARAYSIDAQADLAELTNGRLNGTLAGYYSHKEEGFVSADYNIDVTQTIYGLSANVDFNSSTSMSLSYDHYDDADGKERDDVRLGFSVDINPIWTAEIYALHTKQSNPLVATDLNGSRTDAAVRLTYAPNDNFKAWVFGQKTVALSGNMTERDRVGAGFSARVSEKTTVEAEYSDGSLGPGGYAGVAYQKDEGTQYYLRYSLDPQRRIDDSAFSGRDGGVWIAGATSQINDNVSVRVENVYDNFGDRPTLSSNYGLSYTPSDYLLFDGGIIYGEQQDPINGNLRRLGLSFGAHYAPKENTQLGMSLQYHEEYNDMFSEQNRHTWGMSAYLRHEVSEELRFIANVDAIISESDQSSIRDGRYIEARAGFAYRPIFNDRLNMLFSYTYLEDLPGIDQVNLEGDLGGPRQISHILNADLSYDLNRQWTLGAKVGHRMSKVEYDRGSDKFVSNTATLGILRLDYHLTHQWDLMAEVRAMKFKEADVIETGAVIGAWRHFGNNIKAGVGYQFGDVHDDLRQINGRKEGIFFNIIAKF